MADDRNAEGIIRYSEGLATLTTEISKDMARVLASVASERGRQDEQWGISEHGPEAWAVIIQKHTGRLAAAALEHLVMHGGGYDSEGFYAMMDFYERCVKVAALCVAACECIDRATWLNDWQFWQLRNLPKEEYELLQRRIQEGEEPDGGSGDDREDAAGRG